MELIRSTGTDLTGKRAVVLGRSNIVGKPMAMLLLHENATVTIAHSKTQNLAELTRQADVLVAAVGRPKFVTADMVKPGAVVIDVGMDRDENGKLCGDVDFDGVSQVCGAITPVPGGVGPMTISMLLENTLTAAKPMADMYKNTYSPLFFAVCTLNGRPVCGKLVSVFLFAERVKQCRQLHLQCPWMTSLVRYRTPYGAGR